MSWNHTKSSFWFKSFKSYQTRNGIGGDVDINILKAFINNNEIPVISAKITIQYQNSSNG